MSHWICTGCQHAYVPEQGDVEHGVMPGTSWNDLPEDWVCPDCRAPKISYAQLGGAGADGSGWIIS